MTQQPLLSIRDMLQLCVLLGLRRRRAGWKNGGLKRGGHFLILQFQTFICRFLFGADSQLEVRKNMPNRDNAIAGRGNNQVIIAGFSSGLK
jgi:hypothetical protein